MKPQVYILATFFLACCQLVMAAGQQYANPSDNGGSMLTKQKEPLNVIIVGSSDASILSPDGFSNYSQAIGFDADTYAGKSSVNGAQSANLGDGNGMVPQTGLRRQGGLDEVINGGNHFRYWVQKGSKAPTNALFLAVSVEQGLKQNHMIVDNGYDQGRDQLVANATGSSKSFNGKTYTTKLLKMDSSLMQGVSKGSLNHNIPTDGRVAILEVQVKDGGKASSSSTSNAAFKALAPMSVMLTMIMALSTLTVMCVV
ncbi:hypothetical protein ACI68E_003297 [Malassezia pachydermatis]|uniref:Uncharacterized protein n=1 Tax=Malassezia pachydermatis TaxID=77020 RepID=A0A0M9VPH4_9BASI|nr:hypothetical protein Malapachy_4077 [Malassezia pachydermatis]KOS14255.1 hypothetical protein Malapachy_4077 [Malassezia pachydermatis]